MPVSTNIGARVPSRADFESFTKCLLSAKRVFALCGAGLSASSGLPTFRGAGGLWKNHEAIDLATPDAFNADPSLVWQFYAMRRNKALHARPNAAHHALAEYSRRNPNFLTVSQNVDGLSARANHPKEQLKLIHGSLFDIRCTSFYCDYEDKDNFSTALTPALSTPVNEEDDDDEEDVDDIDIRDLPLCPKCRGILRPGVVWFGESLPFATMDAVDDWIAEGKIDLCIVIGTSGVVYPAAGYAVRCIAKGAKIAVFNTEDESKRSGIYEPDWFFQGDAAELLPKALSSVIGVDYQTKMN